MNLGRSFAACLLSIVTGGFVFFEARDASANTCTWTGPTGGGDWSDPANWSCTSPGNVPGAGDTAVFPPVGDGGASVAVNGAQAVGTLDVTGHGYTFSPADDGGLTIGASATFAGGVAYQDSLNAPIAIGSPVTFSAQAAAELTSVWFGPVAFSSGGSLTTQGGDFLTNGPVAGPGMLVVAGGDFFIGGALNTYSGGTQVLAGSMQASNVAAFGTGPVVVGGTGTLFVTASGIVPNALTLGTTGSQKSLIVQPQSIAGTSQGDIFWAGPVQLTGNAAIEATDLTLTGAITGSGLLTFLNLGEFRTNAGATPIALANPNNTYTGGTYVQSGGLGAVLADYSTSFGSGPITIQGGGPQTNSGLVALADGVTLGNAVEVPGGYLIANGNASVTGPITGQGIALGTGASDATLTVAGTLSSSSDSYGYGLYVYGAWVTNWTVTSGGGTVRLELASPATYTGQTGISSGTLDLGDQPNPLPPGTQIVFLSGGPGTGVLAVHQPAQIGGLDGFLVPALITLDEGAILTIGLGDPAISFQCYTGAITGDGGITFTGDGGNSFPSPPATDGGYAPEGDFNYAYQGPTRIEGNPATLPTVLALYAGKGTALYNGSIPNSNITVAPGGELDLGPASVVGPVVGAGGTVVPYPGAPTSPDAGAAALTLSSGTKVRVVYAGPDAGTSFVAVEGAVSLGDATLVATTNPALRAEGPVVVIANRSDAGVQGTFAGLPEGAVFSASGGMLRVSYKGGDGNDVTLEVPLLDGGTEGGAPTDAGEDGAIHDAGVDSTVSSADGGPPDARAPDAGEPDATLPADASAPLADATLPPEGGSVAPTSPATGGCGCETAGGGTRSAPGVFLGLAVMALFGWRRRRGESPARA